MYGVVEISGHQYKVSAGQIVDVNNLEAEVGSSIDLDQVLFIGNQQDPKNSIVGTPLVDGAKVTAKIVRHDKGRKFLVFKRRPGKWQKRRGHRDHYTCLLVTKIDDGKGNVKEIDSESKEAKKYLQSK